MKPSAVEQASIVQLLTRVYVDIAAVETQYNLLAGNGDFRPRIEYFHDAIRAFTSNDPAAREPGGRLSVEMLAYDVGCLKYLAAMPLSPFTPHAANLSPHTEMIRLDEKLVAGAKRPDRATKENLSDAYQHYAVLFAALLKPFADADYMDRIDGLNNEVRDINEIAQACDGLMNGHGSLGNLTPLIHHLEDDALRTELSTIVQSGGARGKDNLRKLILKLKGNATARDQAIHRIEKAHMEYATAQLALYENSREMLKKMAAQGMNLAGKFVEASIAQTRREMGR